MGQSPRLADSQVVPGHFWKIPSGCRVQTAAKGKGRYGDLLKLLSHLRGEGAVEAVPTCPEHGGPMGRGRGGQDAGHWFGDWTLQWGTRSPDTSCVGSEDSGWGCHVMGRWASGRTLSQVNVWPESSGPRGSAAVWTCR